jgi:hypothetical protein
LPSSPLVATQFRQSTIPARRLVARASPMEAEAFEAAHDSLGALPWLLSWSWSFPSPAFKSKHSDTAPPKTSHLTIAPAPAVLLACRAVPEQSRLSCHGFLTIPPQPLATPNFAYHDLKVRLRCIVLRDQTVGTRLGTNVIANRGRVLHRNAPARKTSRHTEKLVAHFTST